MAIKLNDQQEQNLFDHFKEIFKVNIDKDDDIKLFDLLQSLGLNRFIKRLLYMFDEEENWRFIDMCKKRYDI